MVKLGTALELLELATAEEELLKMLELLAAAEYPELVEIWLLLLLETWLELVELITEDKELGAAELVLLAAAEE